MKEQYYDELLNIKTGRDETGIHKSWHYHRYEPTPYSALETLFAHYKLKSSGRMVDFGCGKGRLNFYLNYFYHASVVGVEMNETVYQEAIENRKNYLKKAKKINDEIQFHCCLAEEYQIDSLDNVFYFFNPFSIQVFRQIINNILISVEKIEREIEILLYYPSEDYIYFIDNYTSFVLKDEVKLLDLYNQNPNERFLVYRLVY